MTMNQGCPFICFFTPSDIAYVLAVIKNGQERWDQAKNPSASPEKKLQPLFSSGEGRKRESGKSMWNRGGLEFYYTVEKNWKELYNDKAKFSVLISEIKFYHKQQLIVSLIILEQLNLTGKIRETIYCC